MLIRAPFEQATAISSRLAGPISLATLTLLCGSVVSQPAEATTKLCGDRDQILKRLEQTHEETPQALGLSGDGGVIEVLISPEGGWHGASLGSSYRGAGPRQLRGEGTTGIVVFYYSAYGHLDQMARPVVEGARAAGVEVAMKRVPELVPNEGARKSGYKQRKRNMRGPTESVIGGDATGLALATGAATA